LPLISIRTAERSRSSAASEVRLRFARIVIVRFVVTRLSRPARLVRFALFAIVSIERRSTKVSKPARLVRPSLPTSAMWAARRSWPIAEMSTRSSLPCTR
jgi:hypothetical protein